MRIPVACNYAVLRFTPYAETREFVNVGVLLICSKLGYMDLKMTTNRGRIRSFFPELDKNVARLCLDTFTEQFKALKQRLPLPTWNSTSDGIRREQYAMPFVSEFIRSQFMELTRLRESLLTFGDVGTILAENPAETLTQLYHDHVERHFAQKQEYQVTLLEKEIRRLLRTRKLNARYQSETLGTDSYRVHIPFVQKRDETGDTAVSSRRAIQPLYLEKKDTSRLLEHGDLWLSRIRRLRTLEQLPTMLFAVGLPPSQSVLSQAAKEVCESLLAEKAQVIPMFDRAKILSFAQGELLSA